MGFRRGAAASVKRVPYAKRVRSNLPARARARVGAQRNRAGVVVRAANAWCKASKGN